MTEQLTFDDIQLNKIKPNKPLLIIGDSVKFMEGLPSQCVDLVIDDVGYDDLEKDRAIGTTTRLTEKTKTKWYKLTSYYDVVPIYSKILKNGRHVYFWRPSFNKGSLLNWVTLIDPNGGLLAKNNFKLRKIIPVLKNFPGMGYSWRSQHETILYAIKTGGGTLRNLNMKNYKDYFDVEWKHPQNLDKIHTSEKPIKAYKMILENSSNPDEIVIEPFAGSFQSAIANTKYKLKRKIVGIEIDEENAMNTYNYYKKLFNKKLEILRL